MILLLSLLLNMAVINSTDSLILQLDGKKVGYIQRAEFERFPFGDTSVDEKKLNQFVKKLEKTVYQKPINALLGPNGNIISEKPGHSLDKDAFRDQFYRCFFQKGGAAAEVPLRPLYPKVDSELLSSLREKQISHYITYFNSYNQERTHNIKLASQAINGLVVFPGEKFSFNHAVGKRTKNKGYRKAPVIVRGEISEDIGGGICQVSSTLFNAVDRAGVQVVERFSHSKKVPYVPPNRDATVSWYGPDFIFKNPYTQPLLIRSNASGGQLIIRIYTSEGLDIHNRKVPSAPSKLPFETKKAEQETMNKKSRH